MNAPTDAKVACASEIWPPSPVKIVIDRKITASTNAYVMRSTQIELTKRDHHDEEADDEDREARSSRSGAAARPCTRAPSPAVAGRRPRAGQWRPCPRAAWARRRAAGTGPGTGTSAGGRRRCSLPPTMSGSARAPIADDDRADERHRDVHEPTDRRGGDRGDDQELVDGAVDLGVRRREQDPGEPGDRARQHPGDHARRGRRRHRRARPCAGSPRPRASAARSA